MVITTTVMKRNITYRSNRAIGYVTYSYCDRRTRISHYRLNDSHSPERVALLDRTLRHERHTVVVLRAALVDAVPVDGHLHALHVVLHIDDDLVVLAHLDARSGDHAVGREDSTLDTVGQHALAVRPHRVGGVRRAHLAGTGGGPRENREVVI